MPNQVAKQYLSLPEIVAEYGNSLGFWRKQVFYRSIAYTKAGRSVKIARSDVEAFHATRRVPPKKGRRPEAK